MKISKTAVVSAAAIGLIGVSGATALAATTATNSKDSLAQDIANKFHLDQSQVQSVIDQHRANHQQNREAKYEERLTHAVTDGKLSDAQKQAVLTEHNKLVSEIKAAGSGDRKQALKNARQEAKTWASQNNIDVKWVLPVHGMPGPGSVDTTAN